MAEKKKDRIVRRINEPVPPGNVRLRLKGPYTGKTIKLAGVQFRNGEATIPEDPPNQEGGLAKYLYRCYQAEVVQRAPKVDSDEEFRALSGLGSEDGPGSPEAGAADDVQGDGDSEAGDSGSDAGGD